MTHRFKRWLRDRLFGRIPRPTRWFEDGVLVSLSPVSGTWMRQWDYRSGRAR